MKLVVSLPFPQEHAIGCYHEPVEYCSQPNTIFLTFVLILSFHLSLYFEVFSLHIMTTILYTSLKPSCLLHAPLKS